MFEKRVSLKDIVWVLLIPSSGWSSRGMPGVVAHVGKKRRRMRGCRPLRRVGSTCLFWLARSVLGPSMTTVLC
jgi:hypothetical protein